MKNLPLKYQPISIYLKIFKEKQKYFNRFYTESQSIFDTPVLKYFLLKVLSKCLLRVLLETLSLLLLLIS